MKTLYILFTFIFSFSVLFSFGQDGKLDSSFGTNGLVRTFFSSANDYGKTVLIQKDKKILIAGNSFVAGVFQVLQRASIVRFTVEGSFDSTFGIGGKIILGMTDAFSIAQQSDSKILIAGYIYGNTPYDSKATIVRLKINGKVDSSFGDNGIFSIHLRDDFSEVRAITVQTDGKIVAIASSDNSGRYPLQVFRLTKMADLIAHSEMEEF